MYTIVNGAMHIQETYALVELSPLLDIFSTRETATRQEENILLFKRKKMFGACLVFFF